MRRELITPALRPGGSGACKRKAAVAKDASVRGTGLPRTEGSTRGRGKDKEVSQ